MEIHLIGMEAEDYINMRAARIAALSAPSVPPLHTISEENLRTLINAAKFGRKIAAIKVVRTVLNIGLKESKDLFEYETDHAKPDPL